MPKRKWGKHLSTIDCAGKFLNYISKRDIKICPSRIIPNIPRGVERIKRSPLSGGLKVVYRGLNAQQEFVLYGDYENMNQSIQDYSEKYKIPIID